MCTIKIYYTYVMRVLVLLIIFNGIFSIDKVCANTKFLNLVRYKRKHYYASQLKFLTETVSFFRFNF